MSTFKELFPLSNSYLLITSLLLGITSVILSYRKQYDRAIVVLFFAAFSIRLFMIYLDPFLHEWDERYHALVAENMMHYPFKPMLRVRDWVNFDYRGWTFNHIWLHKQPLFLWQMALSMKIFGVSEFAARYPDVLMGSISILLLYRTSVLMTANKAVAFIAALLLCYSNFELEMTSGLEAMGSCDLAFEFYVLASIWAYAEYSSSNALKYAMLTGAFAGCAVLTKWLAGLVVFSGWAIVILPTLATKECRKEMIHFFIALCVAVVIFLPWQLYTFHAFPQMARYEMAYNSLHVFHVVESHGGDSTFYVGWFSKFFGSFVFLLLPCGLQLIALFKQYHNRLSLSLACNFLAIFVFFSFIAQTKLNGYFAIAIPMGYIFIAISIYHLVTAGKLYKFIYLPVVFIAALCCLDVANITFQHDPANRNSNAGSDWQSKYNNARVFKNIKQHLPRGAQVMLNVRDNIEFMFYNNDLDAYNELDEEKFGMIKAKHLPAVYMEGYGETTIPAYIASYDSLYVVVAHLQ